MHCLSIVAVVLTLWYAPSLVSRRMVQPNVVVSFRFLANMSQLCIIYRLGKQRQCYFSKKPEIVHALDMPGIGVFWLIWQEFTGMVRSFKGYIPDPGQRAGSQVVTRCWSFSFLPSALLSHSSLHPLSSKSFSFALFLSLPLYISVIVGAMMIFS